MYKPIVFTGFGVGGLVSTFQNMFGDSSHVKAGRLTNTVTVTMSSKSSFLVNIFKLGTKQQLILNRIGTEKNVCIHFCINDISN
jgi:hypothetical protein